MRDAKRTIVTLARAIANDYAGKAFDPKLDKETRLANLEKIGDAASVIAEFASAEDSYLECGFEGGEAESGEEAKGKE